MKPSNQVGFCALCASIIGLAVSGCSHSSKSSSFTEREEGLYVSAPEASARGGVGNYVNRGSILKDTGELSGWQQDQQTDLVTKDEDSKTEMVQAEEIEDADSIASSSSAPADISEPQAVAEADAATSGKLIDVNDKLTFEFGKSDLTPEALANVQELGRSLAGTDKKVRVEGYADAIGGDLANQILSKERARNVRDALTQAGVRSDQIETYGYGEANPVASNSSESGRSQNRRVEIHIS